MVAPNPASLSTADIKCFTPLHFACKLGDLDIIKYLVGSNDESLKAATYGGYLPLHIVCLGGNCSVVNAKEHH